MEQRKTCTKPSSAIILAAGYGIRMVPINTEQPKGLLEIHGQPLIERLIQQLQSVGIEKIIIVVGFLKEEYEYLIDSYHVELIYNPEYLSWNNLYSLYLAREYLSDTYIVPCDVWCRNNPFSTTERGSWYMVTKEIDKKSFVSTDENGKLIITNKEGNKMVGIAYISGKDATVVLNRLEKRVADKKHLDSFWEDVLIEDNHYLVDANLVDEEDVFEINTYEQLRELDCNSNQLNSDAMWTICEALDVKNEEIYNIQVLKKGMTNRSFLFSNNGMKYIMRIPGEGTDKLINRAQEADVYRAVLPYKICDDVVYINPENGYKISRFIENSRNCNPYDPKDVEICMRRLKELHDLNLTVPHSFDIFYQINLYEELRGSRKSVYKDYQQTKTNVFGLQDYINQNVERRCLSHIDAVADNFLIRQDGTINLIDWEYAGMQDPHADIAMFCIYSIYSRDQIDRCIDFYFGGTCSHKTRVKIYCYISACGLLWSNWCEYKKTLGIEFGEYSLRQYRYAKEYFRIAVAEMEKESSCIQ